MKKICLLTVLMMLLLCGCAKTQSAKLVLTDEIVNVPDGCMKYRICVSLPDGVTEAVAAADGDRRLYEAADGSYYVVTEVLPNSTANEAIRQMTGFDAERLGTMKTQSSSIPEYRFSWCTEGENGNLICTGIVAEDEAYCYCLAFCAEEAHSKDCAAAREQVMSGFGLYYDEGF